MFRDFFNLLRNKNNTLSKDVYHNRILLEEGEFYDSLSPVGIPIRVSSFVIKNAYIPSYVPLQLGHNGTEVGEVKNIHWDDLVEALCGDILISQKYNEDVLKIIQENEAGLSVRFANQEEYKNNYILVKNMNLQHVAIVDIPAVSSARIA